MKKPFKQYPIRYVFFTAFSGLMVLILTIIVMVSYTISINQMKNNTSYYQQNLLTEINEQISMQKIAIEQVTLAMSRNTNLQEYLQGQGDNYTEYRSISEVNSSFNNTAFSMPMIDSIDVYLDHPPAKDQSGLIRYYSFSQYKRTDWLKPLKNSDSAWLSRHTAQSAQGEISVISFARTVYLANEKVAAILVVNTKTENFKDLMAGNIKGVHRLLIDSAELPITYYGNLKTDKYLDILNELKQTPTVDLNESGFVRYKDNLVVWSKLFNTDWLLLEITPWEEVSKGSLQLAAILFSIGLITIVLVLLLTFYVSTQFTRPINLLLKNMSEFSLNRTAHDLPSDYQNEFGALFWGYKKLTLKINKLYRDLEIEFYHKRKAEVDALQANINPHFLYNTLDQLNWMAIEAGQEKISQVLELMGKMFRIGLSKGETLIRMKDELTHLESYLKIQQIRLGICFDYRIDVPEDYMDYFIPKLTLQPFVENAIIHGLHDQESGMIVLKIYEVQSELYIMVKDNGIGIKEKPQVKQMETGGYGIQNVRERLIAYFGTKYYVSLHGEDGVGTTVMIKIPKLVNYDVAGGKVNVESRNYR
ncbi:sensor histidine kinase [Peribacillus loiseleuriae]|uniref:sensor histidine kinase n=1 Tax=Peribacillus loiseleuriae TaxID=1679170 RepID=UPI0037F49F25